MYRPLALSAFACSILAAQSPVQFDRDIQPILTRSCTQCHNEKSRASGFSAATQQGLLAGGNRGPAIVPDRPDDSLLIKAVRQNGDLKMPPNGKLADDEVAKLAAWITGGSKFSAVQPSTRAAAAKHWAFQPIQRPNPPATANSKWPRNEIDRFILARLEKEKLRPSPEADVLTLLRRVYLDVIGLPPTPAQVDEYLADKRPNRYELLVDALLSSPHYGERWARHWLDQARFADSDGGSADRPREIWQYRDWVISALNRDMPFNQFVTDQLAGDLLPNATTEQKIATGFNRNAPLQAEAGTDRELYRVEAVMDRVDTTGTVFLGLSVGCARCHDHKYDPISQREYYQMYAFFNNLDEYGPETPAQSSTGDMQVTHGPMTAIGPQDQVAKWEAIRAQLMLLYRERAEYQGSEEPNAGEAAKPKQDPGLLARTETINALKKQLPPLPVAMVMHDQAQPRAANILLGGDYMRKGAAVSPGVLSVFNPPPPRADNKPFNRLDLARWVTDPKNPLPTRVAVNRIWQQYFGVGIVETENDFGAKGSAPSHPELLDWLAGKLIDSGWSQKAVHRLIVTSAAYRQSSNARPELERADPANRLLARQSRLRLDGEIVRDSGLVISGLLAEKVGGPSVFPPQPVGVMESGQSKQVWKTSAGPDRYRRGLYTFHYRTTPNPAMKIFDGANGLLPCTRRARTDTPLQALNLLNDPTYYEMAVESAKRVVQKPGPERIDYAFRLAVVRKPSVAERDRLQRLFSAELDSFQTHPAEVASVGAGIATPEAAAWMSVCRVLLNTDEFMTRE